MSAHYSYYSLFAQKAKVGLTVPALNVIVAVQALQIFLFAYGATTIVVGKLWVYFP